MNDMVRVFMFNVHLCRMLLPVSFPL